MTSRSVTIDERSTVGQIIVVDLVFQRVIAELIGVTVARYVAIYGSCWLVAAYRIERTLKWTHCQNLVVSNAYNRAAAACRLSVNLAGTITSRTVCSTAQGSFNVSRTIFCRYVSGWGKTVWTRVVWLPHSNPLPVLQDSLVPFRAQFHHTCTREI